MSAINYYYTGTKGLIKFAENNFTISSVRDTKEQLLLRISLADKQSCIHFGRIYLIVLKKYKYNLQYSNALCYLVKLFHIIVDNKFHSAPNFGCVILCSYCNYVPEICICVYIFNVV